MKPADVMRDDLKRRLSVLSSVLPSLELTLDLVLFELTNRASDSLNEVWIAAEARSNACLRRLWQGADSLGNSHLFLVNANRDHWPERQFFEKALAGFAQNCSAQVERRLAPHIRLLFWPQLNDFKASVANMPMLCALWALTSTSQKWWASTEHRLALRRIHDFDPVWFDRAYRDSVGALLTIDGLIEPVCPVDFSE